MHHGHVLPPVFFVRFDKSNDSFTAKFCFRLFLPKNTCLIVALIMFIVFTAFHSGIFQHLENDSQAAITALPSLAVRKR